MIYLTDVDECLEEKDECDQTCVNTDGSYYCTCKLGFQRYNNSKCRGESWDMKHNPTFISMASAIV